MKQRKQDFALGMAALVMLALFLGTVMFLYPMLQGGGREIIIHFPHEQGMAPLKAGSPVLLAGAVHVGQVRNVEIQELDLPGDDSQQSRTTFVVRAEVENNVPLYADCRVTTNQPAIGGAGYVTIQSVGTPGQPVDGPIMGSAPLGLSAAIETLSTELLSEGGLVDQISTAVNPDAPGSLMYKLLVSLDDINALTGELKRQMQPGEQRALLYRIHGLVDNLNAATGALREELQAGERENMRARIHAALAHLDESLQEAAGLLKDNRPVIDETLASVESAARRVDQGVLVALQAELDRSDPNTTLGKLHLAMNRVNASLEHVNSMTTTAERTVMLSRPVVESTLRNFQETSDHLRQLGLELLLNPSKLLKAPNAAREDDLRVFKAATSFAEAAARLDVTSERLQVMLASLPPDAQEGRLATQELRDIQDAVKAAFKRFEQAENVLWNELQ